jgi:hypothetical protein
MPETMITVKCTFVTTFTTFSDDRISLHNSQIHISELSRTRHKGGEVWNDKLATVTAGHTVTVHGWLL